MGYKRTFSCDYYDGQKAKLHVCADEKFILVDNGYESLKLAIYRCAIDDYQRYVRQLNRILTGQAKSWYEPAKEIKDKIKYIESFNTSGRYEFDEDVGKSININLARWCLHEYPEVYNYLYDRG